MAAPVPAVAPRPAAEAPPPDRAPAANDRAAAALSLGAGAVPGAVLGLAAGLIGGIIAGVVVAVVVTVVVAVLVWRGSTGVVVRLVGAREPRPGEDDRLANLTDGLCATFGLRTPALMVVDDPVPNTCSLGRDAGAVMIVTTGLLEDLGLIEMEGVVAHELAHLRRHDGLRAAVATTVLAPLARLTGHDGLLHRALGPGRQFEADQVAVEAVRYPPGLRHALAAMEAGPPPAAGSPFSARRLATTRWLWCDPMVGRRGDASIGDLDDTSVRVASLDLV
ncbi:MAG TPA: M48 family metalloprotease [Acidimicrobiales bacterium]|nr:M48 family metalloprotease [Acidimicrobiales bacterium]